MLSDSDSDTYRDTYDKQRKQRSYRPKRRKVNDGKVVSIPETGPSLSFAPLLERLGPAEHDDTDTSFETLIDVLLPEYLRERAFLQDAAGELDENGQTVRPLTRYEVSTFIEGAQPGNTDPLSSITEAIAIRKLKLLRERRRAKIPDTRLGAASGDVTPLPPSRPALASNPHVIDALYCIRTTPYENSFFSRLQGARPTKIPGVIAVDWETITPWMNLMSDVRSHYSLAHPERDQPTETLAPITYVSLQACHLNQVHDLLTRVFWAGINVGDSLDYSPDRCTIIATYKRLVVGVAILSSPQETYITYLAVKAGWDNSQIATSMLYHLITLNPNKDITLHVSVNNSAMVLYNRFGFKAEEFVAGFYDDYLDPQSRASTNAFRLRLRQH